MNNVSSPAAQPNWAALADTQIATGRYFYGYRKQPPRHGRGNRQRCEDQSVRRRRSDRQRIQDRGPAIHRDRRRGGQGQRFRPIAGRVLSTFPSRLISRFTDRAQGIRYAAKAIDQTVLEQAKDEIRMLLRARRHDRTQSGRHFFDSFVGFLGRRLGPAHRRDRSHRRRCGFRSSWWWAAW